MGVQPWFAHHEHDLDQAIEDWHGSLDTVGKSVHQYSDTWIKRLTKQALTEKPQPPTPPIQQPTPSTHTPLPQTYLGLALHYSIQSVQWITPSLLPHSPLDNQPARESPPEKRPGILRGKSSDSTRSMNTMEEEDGYSVVAETASVVAQTSLVNADLHDTQSTGWFQGWFSPWSSSTQTNPSQ